MFANNPRIVTNGIVGAWDALMPDTDRAIAGSRSGAGKIFNATGSTSPSTSAEMYTGRCISLDGGDEYVNCGNISDANVTTGSFTLIGYIRNNDSGNYDVIVQKGNAGHGTAPGYRLRWESDNTLDFICTQSSSYAEDKVSTTGALSQDVWYQVAVTREAGLLSMYINGALNNSSSTAITGTLTNSDNFIIGRDNYGSGSGYFNGQMADWKFFDVALSAPQIKELYVDSKVIIPYGVSQTNLKLWLPFSEGSGLICYDGSGNGNDGTFVNADASDDWQTYNTGDAGLPQLIRGYNRPLFFKKSDTVHVDWTNTQSLDDITLSAWIYPTVNYSYMPIIRLGGAFFLLDTTSRLRLVDGWATSPGSQAYAFSLNTWYHVAVTRVRSGNQILYVNGSQIKSEGAQSSSISMSLVEIGKRSTDYWEGLINEVIVYDGALAAAEIAKLAARGPGSGSGSPLPPDPTTVLGYNSILGYYRNDGDLTWADRSGHAGATVATVYGSNLTSVLFKQGYPGSKSVSTGRDGQGFPLKYQDNGAIGITGSSASGGPDAYQARTDNSITSFVTAQTWEMWFKLGSVPTNASIFQKSANWNNPTGISLQLIYNNFRWSWGTNWAADCYVATSGNIEVDTWYHFVGTSDGTTNTGGIKMYLDGVLRDTGTATQIPTDTAQIKIGSGNGGSIDGQIGLLRVYEGELTQAQVTQNFNAQRSRFNV